MVVVLGYQIYNATTLDKRIREMFDEKTKEVRDDIAISAAKSDAGVLYQVNSLNVKFHLAIKDFNGMIKSLHELSNNAVTMNNQEYISYAAKLIVNSYTLIQRDQPTFLEQTEVRNLLLNSAKAVQIPLSSADDYAPNLSVLINTLKDYQTDHKKNYSHDESKN